MLFRSNDTATTEIYTPTNTLSLHDALQIFVTADAPQASFFRRFQASVRDGWKRMRGEEPEHPPLITMVVAPEAAQRLHHLFRSGTEILVLP